jgi:integrative and conjugative element protein (TIGR02256 family)
MRIKYKECRTGVTIVFPSTVIDYFSHHRQIERNYEVGGQLFASFLPTGEVLIHKVTGQRKSDSRLRNYFKPNKRIEQQEIDTIFREGYHYIGDWHTHPEEYPNPSSEDLNNIGNIFRKSRHNLNYFLLVIVGQAKVPRGLYVGLHDGIKIKPCLYSISVLPTGL